MLTCRGCRAPPPASAVRSASSFARRGPSKWHRPTRMSRSPSSARFLENVGNDDFGAARHLDFGAASGDAELLKGGSADTLQVHHRRLTLSEEGGAQLPNEHRDVLRAAQFPENLIQPPLCLRAQWSLR